ncbi:MAG: tRNA pseudouridine(38-40) synthase TruA [Saprospiraceae bacterium]
MRLAIELCYDGSNYYGWQIQLNQITIQEVLIEKINQLCNRHIDIVGCGRTDTGVHANQYFIHLDAEDSDLNNLTLYKLNAVLPFDISILNIYQVSDHFSARHDAYYRKYIYRIHNNKNPFNRSYSFYYYSIESESLIKLNQIAQLLGSTKNFNAFCKSKSGLENFECTIYESQWKQISEHEFEFHIAANRFVRGMVRLCVGACLSYAAGNIGLEEIELAISSQVQLDKSWSVPAHGLTLVEVRYPETVVFKKM